LCPELAGNVDPLEVSYSDKPAADARIRAFVSTARGLNDVTVEIEKRAVDACRRMRRDLGAPDAPPNAPLEIQCDALRAQIAKLAHEGVEVRIAVALPRCQPDSARQTRCATIAGAQSDDARMLCEAAGALYAQCSLPSVTFAGSGNGDDVVRLGRTLEENLPTLLYAEFALAKRLAGQTEALVTASARIPSQLEEAGAHGLACVGLAARATTRSAQRLQAFLATTGALVASLEPELHEPAAGAVR
jgi:hypothetical protein